MEVVSNSADDTKKIAAREAAKIISSPLGTAAVVIALEGELGAGKTTFAQGFMQAFGITDVVRSPTFLLMKEYRALERHIYHIDCYRLRDSKDLINLEVESLFSNPQNILLIEWPERVSDILPSERITIHLDHMAEQKRKITIL